MSRFIHIMAGDYGEQIAEYVLQGLQQSPALSLHVPVKVRRFWRWRQAMAPKILDIRREIVRIEKLAEGYLSQGQSDWRLPGVGGFKSKTDAQRLLENFALEAQPGNPRQNKQIRFQIFFKDGTQCQAIGDTRVFQNILAQIQPQ